VVVDSPTTTTRRIVRKKYATPLPHSLKHDNIKETKVSIARFFATEKEYNKHFTQTDTHEEPQSYCGADIIESQKRSPFL
jgi:hypothetical protein